MNPLLELKSAGFANCAARNVGLGDDAAGLSHEIVESITVPAGSVTVFATGAGGGGGGGVAPGGGGGSGG